LKTVVVCSVQDSAGTNIRERLFESRSFEESDLVFDGSPIYVREPEIYLVTSRQFIIYVDEKLDRELRPGRSVFISRHFAESGIPSLTAHFTGNFGKADFGGNPGEVGRFSPSLLKSYMQNLRSESKDLTGKYNITLEATHHGPTALNSAVLFVELGSSDKQWDDMTAASDIAEALMSTLENPKSFNKCAVCLGGTHYSEKFNSYLLDSELALGPIIPKYALEYFTPEILQQILQNSDQPIKNALIDKKGLGKFKDATLEILDSFGLEKIFV
jgi:D-aminoacyl-tRNA deacylase